MRTRTRMRRMVRTRTRMRRTTTTMTRTRTPRTPRAPRAPRTKTRAEGERWPGREEGRVCSGFPDQNAWSPQGAAGQARPGGRRAVAERLRQRLRHAGEPRLSQRGRRLSGYPARRRACRRVAKTGLILILAKVQYYSTAVCGSALIMYHNMWYRM